MRLDDLFLLKSDLMMPERKGQGNHVSERRVIVGWNGNLAEV